MHSVFPRFLHECLSRLIESIVLGVHLVHKHMPDYLFIHKIMKYNEQTQGSYSLDKTKFPDISLIFP